MLTTHLVSNLLNSSEYAGLNASKRSDDFGWKVLSNSSILLILSMHRCQLGQVASLKILCRSQRARCESRPLSEVVGSGKKGKLLRNLMLRSGPCQSPEYRPGWQYATSMPLNVATFHCPVILRQESETADKEGDSQEEENSELMKK